MFTEGEWRWEWEKGQPVVRAHDPKDPLKLVATVYPKQRKEMSFNFLIEEAEANAQLIATAPELYEALEQIAEGKGRFSRDPLKHASNTIEDMKALAMGALAKVEGK